MTGIAFAPEFGSCQFKTITVTDTATTLAALWATAGGTALSTLAATKGYLHAIIFPEANVRYDPAGGTPTATVGLQFTASTTYTFENQNRMLQTMKLIREGGANVSVQVAIFY